MKEPKPLVFTTDIRTMRIQSFIDHKDKPRCLVSCDEYDYDDWREEEVNESACFYLDEKQIDEVIEKLKEAKEFLTKKNLSKENG